MSAGRLAGCAALILLCAANAAGAHTAVATRSLRLQLEPDGLSGLVVYRLPQGKGTQLLLAVPLGLAPGDRHDAAAAKPDKAKNGEALALRLAPEALRGLRVAVGPDDAPAAAPRLEEARARQEPSGALEAALLVRASSRAAAPGEVIRLEVESGLPLPITLIAPSGLALELIEGAGRAQPGGLSLHPRPGAPCKVRVSSVGPLK